MDLLSFCFTASLNYGIFGNTRYFNNCAVNKIFHLDQSRWILKVITDNNLPFFIFQVTFNI